MVSLFFLSYFSGGIATHTLTWQRNTKSNFGNFGNFGNHKLWYPMSFPDFGWQFLIFSWHGCHSFYWVGWHFPDFVDMIPKTWVSFLNSQRGGDKLSPPSLHTPGGKQRANWMRIQQLHFLQQFKQKVKESQEKVEKYLRDFFSGDFW